MRKILEGTPEYEEKIKKRKTWRRKYVKTEKRKAYEKEWKLKNREKILTRGKKYYYTHKKQCRDAARIWETKNRESRNAYYRNKWANDPEFKTNRRKKTKTAKLKRKYGLTQEDFSELLGKQMGLCAACKRSMTMIGSGPESCVTDHDHALEKLNGTKVVRGLLCRRCNSTLGFVQDNPKTLRQLAEYLEKHQIETPKTNPK